MLNRRTATAFRARVNELIRFRLGAQGYLEVETPCLVTAPGMEPHLTAFECHYTPELGTTAARPLYLHTSPEYAMKRLLAEGMGHIFQLCKVFRNGEVAASHNPEFTMLEFYRSPGTVEEIQDDLEDLLRALGASLGNASQAKVDLSLPFERLTVRDAFARHAKIDLARCRTAAALRDAGEAGGLRLPASLTAFDDLFFQIFLERIEPNLGVGRATFLTEYPASMAALARLKPGDDTLAERFELYLGGVELANGFGELTDGVEQRRRLEDEQRQRQRAGRAVYPIDERFLNAVGRMPPSGGVAVGIDRLVMLLAGAERIEEVLLFPAVQEW